MKNLSKFLLAATILSLSISCEEDEKRELQKKVNFSIDLMSNGEEVNVTDTIDFNADYRFYLSTFKAYLSNISLVDAIGNETMLEDVVLIDFERDQTVDFSISLPAGEFTKVKFGLGLDAAQNASDPISFSNDHPLASYQGMYWSMIKYRFAVLEGLALPKSGSSNIPVTYHTGTDPLYNVVVLDTDINSSSSALDYRLNITIDLNTIFDGPAGKIDFATESSTHSVGPALKTAEIFMDNMAASINLTTSSSID